jgi:hypothetical protein
MITIDRIKKGVWGIFVNGEQVKVTYKGYDRALELANALICSNCNSHNVTRKGHSGNWLAPECSWWECDDCGHRTDPE